MNARYFIFILLVIFSVDCLGQNSKAAQATIVPSSITGRWIIEHTDSTFGHQSLTEFIFTKEAKFIHQVKLDGKMQEKHAGNFKVIDSILRLEIPKKSLINLKIITLTSETLVIQTENQEEILTYKRSS